MELRTRFKKYKLYIKIKVKIYELWIPFMKKLKLIDFFFQKTDS